MDLKSGFDITFHSPGLSDFTKETEHSAYSGGPPLSGGSTQLLGIQLPLSVQPIQFSLTWATGSVDNNTPQPNPGSGLANLIFSYAEFRRLDTGEFSFALTKSITDLIVFALNDSGGGDDNHDDFIGLAFISDVEVCGECAAPQTPLPAAVPLFVTGLGALGLLVGAGSESKPGGASMTTRNDHLNSGQLLLFGAAVIVGLVIELTFTVAS